MTGDNMGPASSTGSVVDRYLPSENGAYIYSGGHGLFSITTVRAILWRQRLILLGITAAALVLGLIVTLLATPRYESSASVRVNLFGSQILEGQDLADPYIPPNYLSSYLETMSRVIMSRDMAERVAGSLDPQTLQKLVGDDSGLEGEAARMAAIGVLRGGVYTEIPSDAQLLTIVYMSTDPQLAAQVANAYAQNFLADSVDQSIEANSYARTYLEEQIAETRAQLGEAEVRAIEYARSNGIIGASPAPSNASDGGASGTATTLSSANLSDMNQAVTQARTNRIATEQRWQAIASLPAAQLPEVQRNNAIQNLRARLAEKNSQLADLRERYHEDYPQLRELAAEVDTLSQQISTQQEEIKQSIRSEYEIARRQEESLGRELARVSSQTLDEQDRRVQYNLIDREVDAYRSQLEGLLMRYNQIASAANLRSSNLTMLEAAEVPDAPSSPNLIRNLMLAFLLGAGLAALIAVLRETMDDRLRSIEDVEQKLGLPALGQIPYVSEGVGAEIENPFSPMGEAYSSIRASLDFALQESGKKVIQVTSGLASEGKTTSSLALARKYAGVGRRVLLVDMDLRRPAIHSHFGLKRSKGGVVDVLFSRQSLSDAIISAEENLDVLIVGEVPKNPVEILSSGLIAEFLQRAKGTYDVVILDSSPVMGIADAPLLSRFADAVVLVVEANRAHSGQTRTAMRRLRAMQANLIGVIVTKFRALEAGESYNYQYSYYTYSDNE